MSCSLHVPNATNRASDNDSDNEELTALALLPCRVGIVEKFLQFLEFRQAWQLTDFGVDAREVVDVYERVKKLGRNGVDHATWVKGMKVIEALTPLEVTDFQQFWLTPDEEARDLFLGYSSGAGRKRWVVPK